MSMTSTPTQDATESRCDLCGGHSPVWYAPNAIWNRVVGGPDAKDDPGGFLCPVCFIRRAEDADIKPTAWVVRPETPQDYPTALTQDAAEVVERLRGWHLSEHLAPTAFKKTREAISDAIALITRLTQERDEARARQAIVEGYNIDFDAANAALTASLSHLIIAADAFQHAENNWHTNVSLADIRAPSAARAAAVKVLGER
jgi:hypothetical protein